MDGFYSSLGFNSSVEISQSVYHPLISNSVYFYLLSRLNKDSRFQAEEGKLLREPQFYCNYFLQLEQISFYHFRNCSFTFAETRTSHPSEDYCCYLQYSFQSGLRVCNHPCALCSLYCYLRQSCCSSNYQGCLGFRANEYCSENLHRHQSQKVDSNY